MIIGVPFLLMAKFTNLVLVCHISPVIFVNCIEKLMSGIAHKVVPPSKGNGLTIYPLSIRAFHSSGTKALLIIIFSCFTNVLTNLAAP